MNAILHNPHLNSAAVVARLTVNAATLIWSVAVMLSPEGLRATAYGGYILSLAPAWAWGVFYLSVSAIMLYRLVVHPKSKPHPLGWVGYAILFASWGFVEVVLLLFARPFQPTAIATVTVITALAAYGFIANPRARDVAS